MAEHPLASYNYIHYGGVFLRGKSNFEQWLEKFQTIARCKGLLSLLQGHEKLAPKPDLSAYIQNGLLRSRRKQQPPRMTLPYLLPMLPNSIQSCTQSTKTKQRAYRKRENSSYSRFSHNTA